MPDCWSRGSSKQVEYPFISSKRTGWNSILEHWQLVRWSDTKTRHIVMVVFIPLPEKFYLVPVTG